jgi:hypothetical protein
MMINILSANLLLSHLSPKSHPIEKRVTPLANQLLATTILCGQETDKLTQAIVSNRFPSYKLLSEINHPNAIWYDPEALSTLAYQTILLPNHATGQQITTRIARSLQVVTFLHHASETSFQLFHTHLSYGEPDLVKQQLAVIDRHLHDADATIDRMIVGDLNHEYHSDTLQHFFQQGFVDTYQSMHHAFYKGPTYHAFKPDFTRLSKVDWILLNRKRLQVIDAQVLDQTPPPQCGSDHYFVQATLDFQGMGNG